MGHSVSRLRVHRPPSQRRCDSESSEEDPELQAGRLQVAMYHLSHDSLTQPYAHTPDETQQVFSILRHT